MPNGSVNLEVPERRSVPYVKGGRQYLSLNRIADRRRDVLGVETFRTLLTLERRRAQRSGQTFILSELFPLPSGRATLSDGMSREKSWA